jgi:hypothetical protein
MQTDTYKHIIIYTCTTRNLNYTNNPYSLFLTIQICNKIFYTISPYLQQESVKPGFFNLNETRKKWELTLIATCRLHNSILTQNIWNVAADDGQKSGQNM